MAAASLRLVLGDQLSRANPVLAELDAAADRVVMIEAPGEATHVRSHKARIALFLSAMRHFAEALRADGVPLDYVAIDDDPARTDLAARLDRLIDVRIPDRPRRRAGSARRRPIGPWCPGCAAPAAG